ncbi:hypothetical protein V8B97DRAFT_2024611 [Scleroderma yunnanense]
MVKTNLSFTPLRLSKCLKLQLPTWFHMGAPLHSYNKSKDDCLKHVHKVTKNPHHLSWYNCKCKKCKKDWSRCCKDPHKYPSLVEIQPNPTLKADSLTLTHHCIKKNARAIVEWGNEIIFNPSVMTQMSLADCFRVFAPPPPK